MVKLTDVSFSYRKAQVLSGVNFTAENGALTVITGENGSGKTTLMRIVAGALSADSGSVEISGKIGYVPQTPSLFEDMTVRENLKFFASLSKTDIPADIPMGAAEFLDKRVSALSGGMKKRASIACALLGNPQIVLLDEPAASLDSEGREELLGLMQSLKAKGCAVIYIGHTSSEYAALCDAHYILQGGTLTRKDET